MSVARNQQLQDAAARISGFSLLWITNSFHVSWKYWIIMDNKKIKIPGWNLTLLLDKSDLYRLINMEWLAGIDWLNDLTC